MAKRCCRGCVYGLRPTSHWLRIILARWLGLLICFNCAQNPGVIQEVYAQGTCRNFQARCEPSGRREPRQLENADFRYIGLTRGKVAIVDAYNIKHLCEGSRYAGVFPCGTLWGAKIIHDDQEYWLGLFDTELEAAVARDRQALALLGEFAYLNFPHEFQAALNTKAPPCPQPAAPHRRLNGYMKWLTIRAGRTSLATHGHFV